MSCSFTSDPEFCSACGAILVLPLKEHNVECRVCGSVAFISGLLGHKQTITIDFTPKGLYDNFEENKEKEDVGQMDTNRECSKCGHLGMSYTTMQLRSADEGQTIFYYCHECKNREVENS